MHRAAAIARAESRLRQLCCLGLPGPVIAPALYRELYEVLPFETGHHFWLDRDGLVDAWFSAPDVSAVFAAYRDRYYGAREAEVWSTMAEAAHTEWGPQHLQQVLRISRTALERHGIFNEVMKPCGSGTFIRMFVRDGRAPVGAFNVSRRSHDRDFDDDDLRTLKRLEPFVAHALRSREAPVSPDTSEADRALVVVDIDGAVRWRSPQADRLLSLAHGNAAAPPTLPNGLLHIARAIVAVAGGRHDAQVPYWRVSNGWGTFVARAFWLEPSEPRQSMIGIDLVRRVPLALRLYETIGALALPHRQAEVVLLLAIGRTQEQIASELRVSRNTVVYHRRQAYNRLGVDSRHGLRERLLASA